MAIVFFGVAGVDIALVEIFTVGLCLCLAAPAFFSWADFVRLALASAAVAEATAGFATTRWRVLFRGPVDAAAIGHEGAKTL